MGTGGSEVPVARKDGQGQVDEEMGVRGIGLEKEGEGELDRSASEVGTGGDEISASSDEEEGKEAQEEQGGSGLGVQEEEEEEEEAEEEGESRGGTGESEGEQRGAKRPCHSSSVSSRNHPDAEVILNLFAFAECAKEVVGEVGRMEVELEDSRAKVTDEEHEEDSMATVVGVVEQGEEMA